MTDEDLINSSNIYRKILLVTMLASWAHVRHPTIRHDKDKFTLLIRTCAAWPNSDRVSLPQLLLSLRANGNTAQSPLGREAEARLQQWRDGRLYALDHDPGFDELEAFATTKDDRECLKNSRHAELLYAYRCALVHEFREPGRGMEVRPGPPYYHMWNELRGLELEGPGKWELVCPVGFFQGVAERSLANLKCYLLDNDLDPYSFYDFGGLWRKNRPAPA